MSEDNKYEHKVRLIISAWDTVEIARASGKNRCLVQARVPGLDGAYCYCTRDLGHDGTHRAVGAGMLVAEWEQTP